MILGFEKLRSHIPAYAASSSEVRLTKKDILSAAMSYIRDLEALLREPSERWKDCEPTSSMTTTEQTNEVVSAVGQRASSTTSSSEQNDEILQLPRELPHSLTGSPQSPTTTSFPRVNVGAAEWREFDTPQDFNPFMPDIASKVKFDYSDLFCV